MEAPVIGFKINDAKKLFFDKKAVMSAKERAEKKVLGRFGAFVRRDARSSIRKRKAVSKPGKPPTDRTGLLKKFIFFVYDKTIGSVVIGPARLNTTKNKKAPELLEVGGTSKLMFHGKKTPADYKARPYMGPAFESNKQKHMPGMWKDSLK